MNRELNLRNETHYQIIIECLQNEEFRLKDEIKLMKLGNKGTNTLDAIYFKWINHRKDSIIELLELLDSLNTL